MANQVNLNFTVTKQTIIRTDSEIVASGAANTLIANFAFCEVWADMVKYCRFEGAGGVLDILIENNSCVIPWEVIEAPVFKMAVYGLVRDTVMLTTAKLGIKVYQSVNLLDPEPLPSSAQAISHYEQMFERAEEIGNELLEEKEAGEFNGRDGIITTVPTGMFGMKVEDNGHLSVYHDTETEPPPLSIEDGHLVYAFGDDDYLDLGNVMGPSPEWQQLTRSDVLSGLTVYGRILANPVLHIVLVQLQLNGVSFGTSAVTAFAIPEQYKPAYNVLGILNVRHDGHRVEAWMNTSGELKIRSADTATSVSTSTFISGIYAY